MRNLISAKCWLLLATGMFLAPATFAACNYSLSPVLRNHGHGATNNSFFVNTGTGCPWNVINPNSWITITNTGNFFGTGTVHYAIAANTELLGRTGEVTIASETFTIRQSGVPCNYTFTPTTRNHGHPGTNNSSFAISVSKIGCTWSAVNTNPWIVLLGATEGTNNGTVFYTALSNNTPVSRSGNIVFGDDAFVLTQNSAPCNYSLSPDSRMHGHGDSTGGVSVASSSGTAFECAWIISNTNDWITITTNTAGGTNDGTFGYTITPNPNSWARSNIFYVWDEPFIVFQEPTPCGSASLSPTSKTVEAEHETYSFTVNVPGGCPWEVTNTNTWINVPVTSGTNTSSVDFFVFANPSSVARTGTVSVLDKNFTVRQVGAVCDYRLSATNRHHGYAAKTNFIGIDTLSVCSWGITNTNTWITFAATNGMGDSNVTYTVKANTGSIQRTGRVTVAGQLVTISQGTIGCAMSLSPATRNHGKGSQSNAFIVTIAGGCSWNASTTNSWIHLLPPAAGSGSFTNGYLVDGNPNGVMRTGYIMVEDEVVRITQDPATCDYNLSPATRQHGSGARTDFVTITVTNSCSWIAATTNSWITILNGATNGAGTSNIYYHVEANSLTPTQRVGIIYVGGHTSVITQLGITCEYAVSPASRKHGNGLATNYFKVITTNGCPWFVDNTNTWVTITSNVTGIATADVGYIVAANTNLADRIAVLGVQGQTFVITQRAAGCSFDLTPRTRTHGDGATAHYLSVDTISGCSWDASSPNAWITISSNTSGTASANIGYTIAANPTLADRIGQILVEDQIFTITQLAASCSFDLTPGARKHGNEAKTNFFNVATITGCSWNVTNANSWITITSNAVGNASANVGYKVAANTNFFDRIGILYVGDETFTITQRSVTCSFKVTPDTRKHGAGATEHFFSLTTTNGCSWTVDNTNSWITISSNASGTASANIGYILAANDSLADRIGVLEVEGETFTITQSMATCSFDLIPNGRTHGYADISSYLSVDTINGCSWNATSANSWITITSNANGSASANIGYTVAANPNFVERIGHLHVGGETFTITQRSLTCPFDLTPAGRDHGYRATNASILVEATPTCSWQATTTNTTWITILPGASGSGTGMVNYAVSSNLTLSARTGAIKIGEQNFVINQSAYLCNYNLSDTDRQHGFGSNTGQISVATGPTCVWTATTTNTDWIQIVATSATGFTYTVSANFDSTTRTGYVAVADEVLTLRQLAPVSGFVFEWIRLTPNGDIRVRLAGGPSGLWELQSSTNLTTWTKIADLTNTTGRVEYIIPSPGNNNRFYRAIRP